ncbi:MAG: hypothetical protein B6I24_03590 [Bacteroidetes bacterium 4572_128]|nr:MAG: hypothetical protein B6I24_03590 [Bacteroidetes bacterium 4572_128]
MKKKNLIIYCFFLIFYGFSNSQVSNAIESFQEQKQYSNSYLYNHDYKKHKSSNSENDSTIN